MFDTGAEYVKIGVFDTAKALNMGKSGPYETKGSETLYKNVSLTLHDVGTVKTDVYVGMGRDCVRNMVIAVLTSAYSSSAVTISLRSSR